MTYKNIHKATFISRPNRFISQCDLNGKIVVAHVKNTGRCRELLVPGATVYLDEPTGATRKTKYDLVAVEKMCSDGKTLLINMDSSAPNNVVAEFLSLGNLYPNTTRIRREATKGNSRFDFCIEQGDKITYLEVIQLKKQGYGAAIFFVIQMKGACKFRPNDLTHKAFGDALRCAKKSGVQIYAFDSVITPNSITIDQPIEVVL